MFRALRDTFQTGITVTSIGDNPTTKWTVLQIYLQGILITTVVEGGTTVINSVTYTTTAGASDLTWSLVSSDYNFYINNVTIPYLDSSLNSGVYKFVLLSADSSGEVDQVVAEVIDSNIMCCVADKLNAAYCKVTESNCTPGELIKAASSIYITIKASRYSASIGEVSNAQCTYNISATLCESECDCGCS